MIPFFEASIYIPTENPFEVWLPAIHIFPEQTAPILEAPTAEAINWSTALIGIYLLGVLLSTSRFLIGLFKLKGLVKRGKQVNLSGFSVIKTEEIKTPFSFFGNLFWSSHLDHLDHSEKQQILLHESGHINQLHSLDVIVFEVAAILFWWNPMVYAYKYSIREVHEFLADDYVIRQSNKQQYGHLLIGQSKTFASLMVNGNSLALANHFFHSQLKKRIMMMTKKKSETISQLKYLILMPLMVMLIFACESMVDTEFPEIDESETAKEKAADTGKEFLTDTVITFDPETLTETIQIVKSDVFKVVEEMPRFSGCEDEPGGIDAIKKCAQQKMLENIYKSIIYPKEAKDNGTEGTSVVSFIVSSYGDILEPKILRKVSPECDAEVLRVVKAMPPWIPGKQGGKTVNVKYILPVKFKLQ